MYYDDTLLHVFIVTVRSSPQHYVPRRLQQLSNHARPKRSRDGQSSVDDPFITHTNKRFAEVTICTTDERPVALHGACADDMDAC